MKPWSTLGCSFLDFAMPVWFFRHWYPHGFSIRCSYRGQMFWSIFFFGYIALKIGFALPKGMEEDLVVAGLVAGVGLRWRFLG